MALSIAFDHIQTRLKDDRLTALASGQEWDFNTASNVFIERASGKVLLLPNVLNANWLTTGTGAYARFRKSDYTLITGASWREEDVSSNAIGDYYLTSDGPLDEMVILSAALAKNQPLWLSFFPFGSQAGGDYYIEFGWGTNDTPGSSYLSGRAWKNGKIEFYRYGTKIGEGTISGTKDNGQKLDQQYVGLLLLPCSTRELLVVSTHGGSYVQVFDDIDETDTDPNILPNTPFWWVVHAPQQPKVQLGKITFATAGSIITQRLTFRKPPSTAQVTATATPEWYGTANVGTMGSPIAYTVPSLKDPITPASAYDPTTATDHGRDVRIKLDLAGDGNHTPYIYGAIAQFDAITASTADGTYDATGDCVEFTFDVCDEIGATSYKMKFKSPQDLETHVPKVRTLDNRPVAIKIGTQYMGDAVGKAPNWSQAVSDEARRMGYECFDKFQLAKEYLFSEAIPLDGSTIVDAMVSWCDLLGIGYDIDDPGVPIPDVGTPGSSSLWGTLINVGDTAETWFKKLYESYCGNWFMAICPKAGDKPIFKMKDPSNMPTTPFVTLYPTLELAISVGGYSHDMNATNAAWKYVYRSLDTTTLPIEANEVVVLGRDPRTGKPIISTKVDTPSQDPTVAAGSRADNWTGSPRKYGWRDENGITSQDVADRCCILLFDRLSTVWKLREFECELLMHGDGTPGWKGDLVKLYVDGGSGDITVRIKSMSGSSVKEPNAGASDVWQWRPVKYIGDENQGCGLLHTSAKTVRGIEEAHKLKIAKRENYFNIGGGFYIGSPTHVSLL